MIDTDQNKNFCPAPWVSLYVEPNGRVDNCCVAKNNLGNIQETSVQNIIFGRTNQEVQQAMLDNQTVPGCSWCHGGGQNLQARLLRQFPDTADSVYQTGQFDLRYLDVRWNNTCNLACVYCGPTFSSLWANELDSSIKIQREEKHNLLDYVLDNVESLQEVYLAGGEPTLMRENELLLEQLAKRNPNVKILVNTNLLNNHTRIYQQLLEFENTTWLVSFEDRDQRYQYLRHPGRWTQFETNLRTLKTQVPVEQIYFNMVYLSLNAMSIWDTIDWLLDQGFVRTMTLALINNGVFDTPFDPACLPRSYRDQILTRISSGQYSSLHGYSNVTESLAKPDLDPVKLLTHLKTLDHRRNLNSRNIFPEVYQAIES